MNGGRAHQITFDKSKEELIVIHHRFGMGDVFRLLGPMVDPKLVMRDAVRKVVRQARGKLTALHRTTHVYNMVQMINQYKCNVYPSLRL